MTSLFPTATGVWNFDEALGDGYLTLAEIMRSQGFATASFCQNPNAGQGAGLHQGFSVLFDKRRIGMKAETVFGEKLSNWIEQNRDRNMFIYIHIIDPHSPYDPPAPYDRWFRESKPGPNGLEHNLYFDPDWVRNVTREGRRLLYDGEIAYNDYCFKRFIETLQSRELLETTCLFHMSDHGEHLGEHDLWEHHPPGFIQVIHVPLLIHYPGRFPAGQTFDQPVQLIDLMPTILDMSGIRSDHLIVQGNSLLPLMNDHNTPSFRTEGRGFGRGNGKGRQGGQE